jgi:hypothetical protein
MMFIACVWPEEDNPDSSRKNAYCLIETKIKVKNKNKCSKNKQKRQNKKTKSFAQILKLRLVLINELPRYNLALVSPMQTAKLASTCGLYVASWGMMYAHVRPLCKCVYNESQESDRKFGL